MGHHGRSNCQQTSRAGPGAAAGGGIHPSPKGKKGSWKSLRPRPPTPRGLVGSVLGDYARPLRSHLGFQAAASS